MPREIFDAEKRQAMEGAQRQASPGQTHSDLISAEFELALARLYSMIQNHVDTVQMRLRAKELSPGHFGVIERTTDRIIISGFDSYEAAWSRIAKLKL